jgi:hypothetical protein
VPLRHFTAPRVEALGIAVAEMVKARCGPFVPAEVGRRKSSITSHAGL